MPKKIKIGIKRKSMLYKTGVEYGDYTLNHIEGCSHGCRYPCYAMMMAKRFGKIKNYNDWIKPKIVENTIELLKEEIPKYKDKIKYVHLCFTTDPFMYGYREISDLTLEIIEMLNRSGLKCTVLTKGILPIELSGFARDNEYGITLISLNDNFRKEYEPFSASYDKRLKSLLDLHKKGLKTWVSIEPYPTPNIINQDFDKILKEVAFVDKIIFGKLNYNSKVSEYPNSKEFFNGLSHKVIDFCMEKCKIYHIKKGTLTEEKSIIKQNELVTVQNNPIR